MGFMDDLNDMFNKSAAVAGDMLNKGASAAGRMADSANLRFKQGEIDRRWKDACAALGESVIEAVKADPALLSGREKMMADLDAIAKERADVADELQRIATAAEKSAQSEVEVTEGASSSETSDAPKAEANAASECKAE